MSDVDIQTVTLMTTYRVGFLPPEMGSLAAGEFYVELPQPDTHGVPRVWIGVPAYGGVSGDTALLIPPPLTTVAAIHSACEMLLPIGRGAEFYQLRKSATTETTSAVFISTSD
jgi:hypothetical protein